MNEVLINELMDYCENKKYEGAFYIDGEWGTGKTYFIKKFINEYTSKNKTLSDKYPAIYISLNGLKSINDLSKEIIYSSNPDLNSIVKSNFGKMIGTFFEYLSEKNGTQASFEKVKRSILETCKIDDRVFIFDDLERCRIDIQELFGLISALLEKNKIIIIGNEIEIIRYLEEKNYNNNRLIAAILSKNENSDFDKKIIDVKDKPFYLAIKEKVIEKQFYFKLDLNVFFDEISKNFEESTRKLLEKNKLTITRIIYKYHGNNLRTLRSAINSYENIVNKLNKSYCNSNERRMIILLPILVYTIKLKNGEELSFDEDYFDNDILYEINSIKEYIDKMIFNENEINNELKNIFEQRKLLFGKKVPPIIKLLNDNWYKMDDDRVINAIGKLVGMINNNELDAALFPIAIILIERFNSMFVEQQVDLESIYNKMVEYVKSKNEIINIDDPFFYDRNGESLYIKKLISEINNRNLELNKSEIANRVVKYSDNDIEKIKNQAINNKCFFATLDIERIIKNIDAYSSMNILKFVQLIDEVYGFSNINDFFNNDIEKIKEFIKELEKYECKSVIKKSALNYLIERLKYHLKRLGDDSYV